MYTNNYHQGGKENAVILGSQAGFLGRGRAGRGGARKVQGPSGRVEVKAQKVKFGGNTAGVKGKGLD